MRFPTKAWPPCRVLWVRTKSVTEMVMIRRFLHQALRAAALAAAILVSPVAFAVEESTRELAEELDALKGVARSGEDLKSIITTDLGFTTAQVARWRDAVDTAFATDLLEADFRDALESGTSPEGRQAALAYAQSGLAVAAGEHIETRFAQENPEVLVEAEQRFVERTSASENARLVKIFTAQRGPERDNLDMDVYFRAMAVAAKPVIGAEAAQEWVKSAQYLRDEQIERNVLARVAAYSELTDAQLAVAAEKLSEPIIAEFSAQLVTAFSVTMHAAMDRPETEYK